MYQANCWDTHKLTWWIKTFWFLIRIQLSTIRYSTSDFDFLSYTASLFLPFPADTLILCVCYSLRSCVFGTTRPVPFPSPSGASRRLVHLLRPVPPQPPRQQRQTKLTDWRVTNLGRPLIPPASHCFCHCSCYLFRLCLVLKFFSKKYYSSYHIEFYDTCIEH